MAQQSNRADETRIGDTEREQAVSQLGEHYLAGRITKEEYDERTAAAWSARTVSQLQPLFWDLPQMQAQVAKQAPTRSRRRRRFSAFPLVVVAVVLLAALGAPWWAWLILGWMWFSGMFAGVCARSWGHSPSRR